MAVGFKILYPPVVPGVRSGPPQTMFVVHGGYYGSMAKRHSHFVTGEQTEMQGKFILKTTRFIRRCSSSDSRFFYLRRYITYTELVRCKTHKIMMLPPLCYYSGMVLFKTQRNRNSKQFFSYKNIKTYKYLLWHILTASI